MAEVEVEVPHRQVEVVRSSQQVCLGTVLQLLLPPRSPAQKQLVREQSLERISLDLGQGGE